jgi:transcriptional regulator with XRE-family HTH domain
MPALTIPKRSPLKKKPAGKPAAAPGRMNPLKQLRDALGLSRPVFARLMGCSERALANWEAGSPIQDIYKSRLNELRKLYDELAEVVEPDGIGDWLITPNEEFDGLKPIELVERGEMFRIWRMIFLLKSGTPF